MKLRTLGTLLFVSLFSTPAHAQSASVPAHTFVQSAKAAATNHTAPPVTMIKNRFRTSGDSAIAGTRNFVVTSGDLGKTTSEAILQRLSPSAITADQKVRTVNIVVDLPRHVRIEAPKNQEINIGTAIVRGKGIRSIEVNTYVEAQNLKINRK